MCQCDEIRRRLVGLPKCCGPCLVRGPRLVTIDGQPMVLCCTVITRIIARFPCSLLCVDLDDRPSVSSGP